MTKRPRRALAAAVGLFVATPAAAVEPAWEPGEATTSRVKGEVDRGPVSLVSDGVYGRFGGDLDLGLHAGAQVSSGVTGGLVGATLHYLWMAGVSATYVDALGSAGDDDASRLLAIGVDARPAFVPRFAENLSSGPAFLDLTVDSISLGVGAFWSAPPDGSFGDRRGFEASLGFGVPLFAHADGLWLSARGLLRWADAPRGGTESAEPALYLALSWHTMLSVR